MSPELRRIAGNESTGAPCCAGAVETSAIIEYVDGGESIELFALEKADMRENLSSTDPH